MAIQETAAMQDIMMIILNCSLHDEVQDIMAIQETTAMQNIMMIRETAAVHRRESSPCFSYFKLFQVDPETTQGFLCAGTLDFYG